MKKTLHFLAVAVFVFLLAACNIQTVEQYEQMQEQERSLKSTPTPEQEQQATQEENNAEKNDESSEQKVAESDNEEAELEKKEDALAQENDKKQRQVEKQKTKTEEKEVVKDTEKPEQPAKKEQSSNKDTAAPVPNSNEQKQNIEKQKVENPKQPPVEKTEPLAEKKQSVTIAIRVDTLLKHWDMLDPALQSEKYVPKNGAILKSATYELLSEKDTVWDVLQRATKEHKIQMEYQGANENIYNSVYIEGINHLYEFSAGELSGWMYKVNGVYPNYGCSQYVLKDGDVIEWNYTVDLGRDLGHLWDGN